MNYCKKCHDPMFTNQPCCCQEYTIIDEDGEESTSYATDEHSAALKYAQQSNEANDYYLTNESRIITINGNKYKIEAEPDINYTAISI